RMAYCEMANFDKTITIRGNIKIDVTEITQRIIRSKSAQSYDLAFGTSGRIDRINDVGRASRAADSNHEIPRTRMQLDLFRENLVVAEVMAEAGEHRPVME